MSRQNPMMRRGKKADKSLPNKKKNIGVTECISWLNNSVGLSIELWSVTLMADKVKSS